MWSNSFLSHLSKVAGHGGETTKKGPAVRYSAIPSDGVPSTFLRGPQVFLDLDVEDTVTCFCRFVQYFTLQLQRDCNSMFLSSFFSFTN